MAICWTKLHLQQADRLSEWDSVHLLYLYQYIVFKNFVLRKKVCKFAQNSERTGKSYTASSLRILQGLTAAKVIRL